MYIYLVHTSEAIIAKQNIYKIGKTDDANPHKRIIKYPKGSRLLFCIFIDNKNAERDLLHVFDGKFECCRRMEFYGREYYRGDHKKMIDTIIDYHHQVSKYSERWELIEAEHHDDENQKYHRMDESAKESSIWNGAAFILGSIWHLFSK